MSNETAKPRVRELFFDDGQPAKVHLCTACDKLYDVPEHATCCEPQACACGAPTVKQRTLCATCLGQHKLELEAERWAAATPKPAEGYDDPVYVVTSDGVEWGRDGWHSDLSWLRDTIADHHHDHPTEPLPELHVYATKARRMDLDADHILEHALEEFHDDAQDEISDAAAAGLQVLLDAWVETYSPTTYEPDTGTKIVGWEVAPTEEPADFDGGAP
jgi:hypothetical protein